ncbi:queuine tRNA-ribosyltransferase, putative [Plasmodium gallinaceum]|uniref:Queuine tRNA-ribosyltransferase, putative n=1 Tax=Plasmodium gallinaceum TaxID=5849 RepID=A0A1J1GWX6_PLAGA|nr:queuine tRNA-ribosyltransferase, putative [Plasmodium gallinaceum]CRG97049.1 queuine tRNA-ribosyltransferase, putative [Plasmodium gallinaceum]
MRKLKFSFSIIFFFFNIFFILNTKNIAVKYEGKLKKNLLISTKNNKKSVKNGLKKINKIKIAKGKIKRNKRKNEKFLFMFMKGITRNIYATKRYLTYRKKNNLNEIKKYYYNNINEKMKRKCIVLKDNCFNYPFFDFTILKENKKENNKSRVGIIKTPRGIIETPNFLFCATKACIKSTPIDFLKNSKTQIILSNTFHLLIQPKPHVIFQLGGLHKFMNWKNPILTDSGGYQIFSMSFGSVSNEIKRSSNKNFDMVKNITTKDNTIKDNTTEDNTIKDNTLKDEINIKNDEKKKSNNSKTNHMNNEIILKINERGVIYRSYYDGSIDLLSPETSIQSQYLLGSDFILVLDECTPYHVDREYTERSMHRSHRWYLRCLLEFYKANNMENYHEYLNDIYNKRYKINEKWVEREKNKQALYGIIQGGIYTDLRKKSCDFVCSLPFFGLCIGGCLGKNKEMMYSVIETTMNFITKKKPIHLLGIGQIRDIFYGVKRGIDTFDCVIPSRLARHGYFLCKVQNIKDIEKSLGRYIKNEYVKIKLNMFKLDNNPLEKDCDCYTCLNYSRAYLHFLYKINDNLLGTLLTIHNVNYMNQLMLEIRNSIKENNLDKIEEKWIK